MVRPWHVASLMALAASLGCADAVAPLSGVPRRVAVVGANLETNPGYPVEEDYTSEELQQQQDLIWVTTQAGAWFDGSGQAFGIGHSDFFANNAYQDLELRLYKGATQTASSTPHRKTASGVSLFGSLGSVDDTTKIPSSETCGISSTATATGHAQYVVFNRGFSSLITLSDKSDPKDGSGYMNPCDEYVPAGGGGGGGECIQAEGCDLGQCPLADQYEWYHWDGFEYADEGEVCLD